MLVWMSVVFITIVCPGWVFGRADGLKRETGPLPDRLRPW
jgi:hypothetical protein